MYIDKKTKKTEKIIVYNDELGLCFLSKAPPKKKPKHIITAICEANEEYLI
jgi:hypothetical protein